MVRKEVKVNNSEGLQSRAAAAVVKEAGRYASHVSLQYEGKVINAKSLMGVLSLAARAGSKLAIFTEGADEGAAAEGMYSLISSQTA